ncbi:arginine--tRNA ligase [Planctomicrobium sp. SH661]|uniref:arginine--tRNA ligase n=1 Tax=Planctomicrobium sp. SH661 TaxID=3448124 RepID=UPI003F5C7311
MNILRLLKIRFSEVLGDFTEEPAVYLEMVRPAQDTRFGDYQANFAMPLAKRNGTNPREVALRIIDKLDVTDVCSTPEVAGPGFINLTLLDSWLEQQVNAAADDDRLGVATVQNPKTVVVDFSSPNVAKPMHVGHLRSTVIGDALVRILRFLGHNVIADNHIGDWGTQFGMIIYGFKHLVDPKGYQTDAVGELARLYRLVNQLCDYHDALGELPTAEAKILLLESDLQQAESAADPKDAKAQKELKKQRAELAAARDAVTSLKKKIAAVDGDASLKSAAEKHPQISRLAREETAKLHAGDLNNLRLWEEFLPQCLQALQRVYDRLEINFDLALGESYYNPMLADVVTQLEQKQLACESDGATCVFVEGHAAPFIVRKGDGAYTYATTDLATIRYRVETLKADTILYVVDARQGEHFKLLFATARKWGYDSIGLQHVSFGTVMGQDGRPYKTRSGDTVGLESLLDEAVAKALEIVVSNDESRTNPEGEPAPELSEELRKEIAEMVGIGGIKYADLMHNRESDYTFDSDKMLAMTGNTATYLQYAHARVQGIFRKGGVSVEQLRQSGACIQIKEPAERALALKLCRYAETLDGVVGDCRPNLLTQYLFELAGDLTSFYDQCPVLRAPDESTRSSRLRLCDLAGRILAHGLSLLGIAAPQKM